MVGRPYSDISFGAKNKCSELLGIDPHFDPKTHKLSSTRKLLELGPPKTSSNNNGWVMSQLKPGFGEIGFPFHSNFFIQLKIESRTRTAFPYKDIYRQVSPASSHTKQDVYCWEMLGNPTLVTCRKPC